MLEGLSPLHLILILGIVLLVVGPGKLPETGAAIGRAVRSFRDSMEGREPEPSVSPQPAPPPASAPPGSGPVPSEPASSGDDVTPTPPQA